MRLEQELRDGGVAALKVSTRGRTAIEDIVPAPNPDPPEAEAALD